MRPSGSPRKGPAWTCRSSWQSGSPACPSSRKRWRGPAARGDPRVRRGGGQADEWAALVGGAVGALWRWRVELALLAVPAGAWWLLARPLGAAAAAAIVAW